MLEDQERGSQGKGIKDKIMQRLRRRKPSPAASNTTIPVAHETALVRFIKTRGDKGISLVAENRQTNYTTLTDILGNTRPGDTDIRKEENRVIYKRPTWEYTKKLRGDIENVVKQMSTEDQHNFVTHQLPQYLLDIGEMQMPLEDIHTLSEMINVIERVRSEQNIQRKRLANKSDSDPLSSQEDPEYLLDNTRLYIADILVYRVAFQEGLFGPNDLGYLPDTTSSLANNESDLMNTMSGGAQILAEKPTLFGDQTQKIYEGFASRLNRTRALFLGRRVDSREFPPFPAANKQGPTN